MSNKYLDLISLSLWHQGHFGLQESQVYQICTVHIISYSKVSKVFPVVGPICSELISMNICFCSGEQKYCLSKILVCLPLPKKINYKRKFVAFTRKNKIDQFKNRKGNFKSFLAYSTCVTKGSLCLLEHLLSRYPLQLFHFGLLLIISSAVCQGQRFAFSPGPLYN